MVDVKRLKHQLWEFVQPRMPNAPNQESMMEVDEPPKSELKMSDVLGDMRESIQSGVSVHSAFICMLHLANEKGLKF